MKKRLEKQLEFLKAADALKGVSRKTSILSGARLENSAEHSWHGILTAMMLAEHANEPIDLFRVVQMFALHDLGELECGDTFHYDKSTVTTEQEAQCMSRLLSILPPDQAEHFGELWQEFESGVTAEARFAAAVDRLWPCIQNYTNNGGTWLEFKISLNKALEKNKHIANGSTSLWEYVEELLQVANTKNLLYKENSSEKTAAVVPRQLK